MHICKKDTPVLALKIIKSGVGMYIWPSYYVYGLNNLFVYLTISGTLLLFMRKANLVCFIYMQPNSNQFK